MRRVWVGWFSALSKQRPTKHTKLVHHARPHSSHPRPNKIRPDAARRANEFHRDPRHALLRPHLPDKRRDVFPIDVIPRLSRCGLSRSSCARHIASSAPLPSSLSSDHMLTHVPRTASAPSEGARNRSSTPGWESTSCAFWHRRAGGRCLGTGLRANVLEWRALHSRQAMRSLRGYIRRGSIPPRFLRERRYIRAR